MEGEFEFEFEFEGGVYFLIFNSSNTNRLGNKEKSLKLCFYDKIRKRKIPSNLVKGY